MRKTLLPTLCLALLAVACDGTSERAVGPSALAPASEPASSAPAGAPVHAAAVACGATIFESVKLDHNLTCGADGLIIGADGIRIDLNGYTLAGSGSGVGIVVAGRNDIMIRRGSIRNFAVAVRLNDSTGVRIDHNEFVGNPEGIDLQSGSIGNIIHDNAFRNSATRAIMLRGGVSGNEIKANTFSGDRVGILLFAGTFNTLKDNTISGATLAGIRINALATGNVIKANTVMSGVVGMEFLVMNGTSATGNELKGNSLVSNACGLKGPTAGNSLKDNAFQSNVTDTCS